MNTENHLLSESHQSVMLSMLSQTMPHLKPNHSNQQQTSSQMGLDLPQTTVSNSSTSNNKLQDTIDVLLGSIQVLNDDIQQLSNKALRAQCSLPALSDDLTNLKVAVQETNACTEGLKPNQQTLLQDFNSLKQDVEDQQSVSYDGTSIWRITDVQKKIGM